MRLNSPSEGVLVGDWAEGFACLEPDKNNNLEVKNKLIKIFVPGDLLD